MEIVDVQWKSSRGRVALVSSGVTDYRPSRRFPPTAPEPIRRTVEKETACWKQPSLKARRPRRSGGKVR